MARVMGIGEEGAKMALMAVSICVRWLGVDEMEMVQELCWWLATTG